MPIIYSKGTPIAPLDLKYLRVSLQARMQYLADHVGSHTEFARIANVNRTQMSRYLNGSSVPRAELLAQLAHTFGVTLDWFFDTGNPEGDIAEGQFGIAMRELVRSRDLELDDDFLPDGFYLFWKEMFSVENSIEVLLGRVSKFGSVKKLRFSMVRDAVKHGYLNTMFFRDRSCESVLCRSAGNLCMLSSDNKNNVILLGNLTKRTVVNRLDVKNFFYGVMFCPSGDDPGRKMLVRTVLEKIPNTTKDLLNAGRMTGRMPVSEMPERIRKHYDAILMSNAEQ